MFVKLHNNVVVCAHVDFIIHDVFWRFLSNNPKYYDSNLCKTTFYNTIEIFDDVMIGTHSVIRLGVKIGPNAIVGAGSVVINDVPEGAIVGGNPARVIGSVDEYAKKKNYKCSVAPYDGSVTGRREISKYLWENDHER